MRFVNSGNAKSLSQGDLERAWDDSGCIRSSYIVTQSLQTKLDRRGTTSATTTFERTYARLLSTRWTLQLQNFIRDGQDLNFEAKGVIVASILRMLASIGSDFAGYRTVSSIRPLSSSILTEQPAHTVEAATAGAS